MNNILDINRPNSATTSYFLTNSKTLSANNTTANVGLFRVTGTIRAIKLGGIVTTVIGANHTGAYFRLNDQNAPPNITLNTGGATLSAVPAGSIVFKTTTASSVATITSAAAGAIVDAVSTGRFVFSECALVKRIANNTDIEYTYTTTDAPTSGVILFFLEWQPISADGSVAAL